MFFCRLFLKRALSGFCLVSLLSLGLVQASVIDSLAWDGGGFASCYQFTILGLYRLSCSVIAHSCRPSTLVLIYSSKMKSSCKTGSFNVMLSYILDLSIILYIMPPVLNQYWSTLNLTKRAVCSLPALGLVAP